MRAADQRLTEALLNWPRFYSQEDFPVPISSRAALLVIDVQNDFIPGGQLPVPEGEQIVPLINRLARQFRQVVIAQDWHPSGHISFASSHLGRQPYDVIELPYGAQTLSRDFLLNHVFEKDSTPFDRSIDVCVSRLRQQLTPELIKTVRNEGYMLTSSKVTHES